MSYQSETNSSKDTIIKVSKFYGRNEKQRKKLLFDIEDDNNKSILIKTTVDTSDKNKEVELTKDSTQSFTKDEEA